MNDFLEQVAEWVREIGLATRRAGDGLLRVTPELGTDIDLRFSVGKLWLRQQVPVPSSTTDAAAATACRLVNLTRRGPLAARWRGKFVELTGSISAADCSRETIAWLFKEALTMRDLLARHLPDDETT